MAMDRDQFLTAVRDHGGLPSLDDAEAATRATLQTLAEHLNGDEAGQLASELPAELVDGMVTERREAERFGLQEFVRRVGDRAGLDEATAQRRAQAVLAVAQRAVPVLQQHDMLSQLPSELGDLFRTGPGPDAARGGPRQPPTSGQRARRQRG